MRVPFLVRWPGRTPAGRQDDTTVLTAVDLLPTLCAAAGVALPADYRGDGENLLEALLGRPVARRKVGKVVAPAAGPPPAKPGVDRGRL